jgi:hypothetical protein
MPDPEKKRQLTTEEQKVIVQNEINIVNAKVDFLEDKVARETGRAKEIMQSRIDELKDIVIKDKLILLEVEFEEEYDKTIKANRK